jgi:DNA replication protein DnaC
MYKPEALKVKRKAWLKLSGVPASSTGWRLEDCTDLDADDAKKIAAWVTHAKNGRIIRALGQKGCGRGLLLHGDPGFGKSTVASAILQEMITKFMLVSFDAEDQVVVRPCYFSSYNAIVALKGSTMNDEVSDADLKLMSGIMGECKDDAYNVRVLVIDDIGKEHMSQSGWQRNLLHDILRTRYSKGLPTIVTTNLEVDDWAQVYGEATGSFINEAFGIIAVKSKAGDLRLKA